jgi:phosphatidylglycerophosphate synthase
MNQKLIEKTPSALIYLRLVLGLMIIPLSYFKVDNYITIAIIFLSVGLISDIFDGIIARKLNISTVKLRRLDSTIDVIFFLSFAVATYLQCPNYFALRSTELIIIVGLEALTYLVCFIKFKKEVATHSIGAKIWTILMFATLVEIILTCHSSTLFYLFFIVGIITRLEIIAIILILKEWTNDVPSIFDAINIRKGKPIKRNKLFNG